MLHSVFFLNSIFLSSHACIIERQFLHRCHQKVTKTMKASRIRQSVALYTGLTASSIGSIGSTTAFQGTSRTPSSLSRSRTIFSSTLRYNAISVDAPSSSKSTITTPAEWHRERRRQMLQKYGDAIAPLERHANSQAIGLPLLVFTSLSLLGLSVLSGSLSVWGVLLLSVFPGSMLSVWQLQLLHDVIHGSMLEKSSRKRTIAGIPKQQLQDSLLFWGSLPSFYGYYLYLKAGHLSHHSNLGQHSLAEVFDSDKKAFEDGDVLFVAHRMKLAGDYGPKVPIPFTNGKRTFKMSISKSGFHFWEDGSTIANGVVFAISFLYERFLLAINDVVTAVAGKNLFFLNKPESFQKDCVEYARVATAIRLGLWITVGWKSVLFLYLSESLWSLPPHPSCAMFVTNHGSGTTKDGNCIPTKSTYAGRWYSWFTLGTNFHCEHHDFPTIPFHRLHELRKIAPEFYSKGSNDNLLEIMSQTFAHPEFYACMDASSLARSTEGLSTERDN